MNYKKRDYAQAIDLEYLNFEELGRSPVSKNLDFRIDPVGEKLPLPHFFTQRERKGNPVDREMFSNEFGRDLA